jgi:tetratricopeptide (TPR) repeat protein
MCRNVLILLKKNKMVTKNKAIDELKKLETNASEPDQMMNIAHQITEEVGDKDWAINVFKKSIVLAHDYYDPVDMLRRISQSIIDNLGDYEWADSLMSDAYSDKSTDAKGKITCAYFYSCFTDNESFIKKSINFYTDCLKLSEDLSSEDLYQNASSIFHVLNQKELAIKYLISAEKCAESPWDYIFIAKEYFGMDDKKSAKKLSDLGLSECEDDDEKESLEAEIKDYMNQ